MTSGFAEAIRQGIPSEIPDMPPRDEGVDHAPARPLPLKGAQRELAVRNALRYLPEGVHAALAGELASELAEHGRI